MRTLSGFLYVFALVSVPLVGCGGTGDGTDAGTDAGDLCEGVVCDGENECTTDVCDPADGTCDNAAVADGTDCDFDGLPGLCMSGVCEDAMLCEDVQCNDNEECTTDDCDPADGTCDFTAVEDRTDCDFGGLPGLCMSGVCEDAKLCEDVECEDDQNECTADACDPATGTCYPPVEDGTDCDFGGLPGLCTAGVCEDAMLCVGVECEDDENECTNDLCNPADGICVFTPVLDDTECDFDGVPGLCMSGVCKDAMRCEGVACNDSNQCTADVCDPTDGTCDFPPVENGTECDFDGYPGRCMLGVCEELEDAIVLYDRTDPLRMSPFPDDYWLVPDASTPTGYRVALTPPPREFDIFVLYTQLMNDTASLDGFSPIGAIVVELSEAPDTSSLPLTPEASLDPSAPIGLFDLTPGSDTYGQRVPFNLDPVSRQLPDQVISHSLILHPSLTLSSKGRYALVVTRAIRAADARPFGPSPFMMAVLAPGIPGEADEITKARNLLNDGVLDALADEEIVSLPLPAADIALAVRITVQNTDDLPRTPLSMRQQIFAAPPPTYEITSVDPGVGAVAAVARGTWQGPNWREDQYFIARDDEGNPRITGSVTVPFVLAVPQAAEAGPVPVVMFQHGSPGSSEQLVWEAQLTLAEAGFAVMGFTDALNRDFPPGTDQSALLFQTLLLTGRYPDHPMQTYGDQLAFLRVIEQLGALDVVPLPNGDGVPDLDLEAPLTYVGLSMGSVHGSAFLAYAPEIKAAAIAAGAGREAEGWFAHGAFIDDFPPDLKELLPNAIPVDYWIGLSIFQMLFDHQDAYNHARFLYRNRLEVAGTTRKASVLYQEGVGDPLLLNSSTRSTAWTFGPIPHLEPIWDASPFLQSIAGPVMANIDSETTAAFYQFVPAGIPGIPHTPGCANYTNGHSCAQAAPEAQQQRALFLQSAVEQAVPVIVDPLASP